MDFTGWGPRLMTRFVLAASWLACITSLQAVRMNDVVRFCR